MVTTAPHKPPPTGSYVAQQQLKSPTSVAQPKAQPAHCPTGFTGVQPEPKTSRTNKDNTAPRRAAAAASPGMPSPALESRLLASACSDGAVVVTATAPAPPLAPATSSALPGEDCLSAQELDEASLRCYWLAHYWGLAHRLGICMEVSKEQSEYWASVAPVQHDMYCIVRRMVAAVLPGLPLPKDDDSSTAGGDTPPALDSAPGPMSTQAQVQARTADLVDLERAMRQLCELGVVQEVQHSLAYAAQVRSRTQLGLCMSGTSGAAAAAGAGAGASADILRMCQEGPDPEDPSLPLPGSSSPSAPSSTRHHPAVSVSELERREMRFLRCWLAYMWCRAAAAGVEPQLALVRAEAWASCLGEGEPCGPPRQWCELSAALRELQLLGVEQLLWQKRNLMA